MRPYQVIAPETAPRSVFEVEPTEVILVATLEVAIADSHGEYLLITSPRYDDIHAESSQWTPPYVAQALRKPRVGWKNVGQVKKAIEEVKENGLDGWRPQHALQEVIATWACGLSEVGLVAELTEYKRSWTSPEIMKVYHVMRFAAQSDTCVHRALADPDSRKGFAFLPIDEERYRTAIDERECERHGREELLFIGQPLASNLSHVVEDPDRRAWLRESAIEIPRDEFFREHEGLLVCGDIANYGASCRYAHDHMQGIDIDGDDAADLLRDLATIAITRVFHDAGLSQVHTAGDGFIAALPETTDPTPRIALQRFLRAWVRFTELLDKVNERIASHASSDRKRAGAPVLGSRLAVHFGNFRFGKMAQAASLVSTFDGAAIIDVARLEQGLRAIVKDPARADEASIGGVDHAVILSASAATALGGVRNVPEGIVGLKKTKAVSKEATQQSFVGRFEKERVRV
jgi:hypothetical protein